MKLYIAGPMTGLPDFNYPAFFKAEEQLDAAGFEIENPARNQLIDRPEGEPMWLGYMRMSLVQISRVDGIALLPGWEESEGARLEEHIGRGLKIPVKPIDEWLYLGAFRPRVVTGLPARKDELLLCPECAQGKTVNCVGQTMHPESDNLVACGSLR